MRLPIRQAHVFSSELYYFCLRLRRIKNNATPSTTIPSAPTQIQLMEDARKIAVGPSAPPMTPTLMFQTSCVNHIALFYHARWSEHKCATSFEVCQDLLIPFCCQLAWLAFFAEIEFGEFCVRAFHNDLSVLHLAL